MIARRYQLLQPIALGDRSTVFRALDTELTREVAIKRYSPAMAAHHQREAEALARLTHPNIVRLIETGTDAQGGYLVLELLKGETLSARLCHGPLTTTEFMSLARQGLQTLAAIHRTGLIHRDLTPDNLMLEPRNDGAFDLKFIDLELAQPVSETYTDTATGSVHFMAPEQFDNLPLDARTDIYAFGAVLYFAATQRYPFDGETNAQIITAHLYGLRTPLAELRTDFPRPLLDWIAQLIRRDSAQRPPSADAALEALVAVSHE